MLNKLLFSHNLTKNELKLLFKSYELPETVPTKLKNYYIKISKHGDSSENLCIK